MAPGIVSEAGMEPEMKILAVERTFDDLLEFLADHEPGDAFPIVRIDGLRDRRLRPSAPITNLAVYLTSVP